MVDLSTNVNTGDPGHAGLHNAERAAINDITNKFNNQFRFGSGIPEGVVTAPVGTKYYDSQATSGAVEWVKASGTGSTGWRVSQGDTGWRDEASAALNGWTASQLRYRRINGTVFVHMSAYVATAATADTIFTLPVGFRPSFPQRFWTIDATVSRQINVDGAGGIRIIGYQASDASLDFASMTFAVSNTNAGAAWPATLSGTAV